MRTNCLIAAILATALPLVTPSCAEPIKPPQPTNCILAMTVSGVDCPWNGMTDNYQQEQSNKFVQAVSMDGVTNSALPSLAEFETPDVLMVRDVAQKRVTVNSRYFSDLQRGDATRLATGVPHRLGMFRDLTFARLKPRDLVMFMVKAQIVETYWHIEAELKLAHEEDAPETYRAWFSGTHTYFTNEQNIDSLAFVVTINKKTGEMTLTGGDLLNPGGSKQESLK